ncbi:hypothetical protein ADK96_25880 [Streptomyces sp. IGB124]|nr:hypothetical protein ADK96_25880 [Streptomyces sp. IGB124]
MTSSSTLMSSTHRSSRRALLILDRSARLDGTHVRAAFCCDVEGDGDADLRLVQVGHVHNERQFVAGVYETESGGAAHRGDDGVCDPVHALGGCRYGLVGGVAGGEAARGVVPAAPGHSRALGLEAVAVFDTSAFVSEQLLSV